MPNTKSAKRRVRRVKKQTKVNQIRKSKYKKAIKDIEKLKKFFPKFQSILMQVAKSGIINKKTASRKISRISKRLK